MTYIISQGVAGLIFDLDGTLADTMPLHMDAWKKAASLFGIKIDSSFLRAMTGAPGWIIAEEMIRTSAVNGKVTVDELMEVKQAEFKAVQHLVKPIDPVVDIVKRYYGSLPMAIGTGGHREAVVKTMEITGLTSYFDIIVTANDVSRHKPHPETFLRCAQLMGIDASLTEVFEDGDLGIEAAIKAGMKATDVRSWYNSVW